MATPTNLPASAVAGEILTAAYVNNLRGAFRVLQIVEGTYSTLTTNNTSTYADTGLTATITPTSTSSKILVVVNHTSCLKSASNSSNAMTIKLLRGATDILQVCENLGFTDTAIFNIFNCTNMILDSPATISATTYKTQFKNQTNAAGVQVQAASVPSKILLFEISA